MAITITSFAPPQVGCRGGSVLVITGTFPVNTDLSVTIGGVAAFGGTGFGLLPQSQDGLTLSVGVPPLPPGNHQVAVSVDFIAPEQLAVLEHNWGSKTFSMRSSFPPIYAVGHRQLSNSDQPDS